jgi:hypothetical protein
MTFSLPVPVAARSKEWVYGCSLTTIAGSNPAGGHGNQSLVGVVCCQVRGLCDGPIPRPGGFLQNVCVCVIECDQVQH